nr:hypothetical protein [Candidatus Phytoplasma sacchari]KAB8121832.1 hypothetical protein F2B49_02085 [Candidatus Phytoplasma sacchari]
MRKRNKSFLFLLLFMILLLLLLFLPFLFPDLFKEGKVESKVSLETQTQPAVQEQPVVEPQTTLSPEVIQEGLNSFRALKKNKIYENLARNFMNLGLTSVELTNLNAHQKDLFNKIVAVYSQAKSSNFEEIFKARDLAKPFMDEFKKELNLPRPKPVVDSSISSASDSKKFSDYLGTFFDVVGEIQDAALSGLKKGAAVSLLPSPGLAL